MLANRRLQVVKSANERLQNAQRAVETAKTGAAQVKLESIQASYESARAEGSRELRMWKATSDRLLGRC